MVTIQADRITVAASNKTDQKKLSSGPL